MSFKTELKARIEAQNLTVKDLVVDKDSDYKGRAAVSLSMVLSGEGGPVHYEAWITDDLKLPEDEKVGLAANNAVKEYHNHIKELDNG